MRARIERELEQRTLILDGALGTMIQQLGLSEETFRGERLASWHCPIKGLNDILCLTKPEIISNLHREYLAAGADIITTNSFNANSISLRDYDMQHLSYELSRASAEIARTAADSFSTESKPRLVAGSLGPTNKTSSIAVDMVDPAAREVSFDELVESYSVQIEGLLDGGVDLIILETIFDTLNAKAALYAIETIGEKRGEKITVMISATISGASGRSLSGQTIEALYCSLSHLKPLSFGFNCAFGARDMLPYLEQLDNIATCYTSAYPNAGLPNVMGGYDESAEEFSEVIEEFLRGGLVNIIGGCCGTTPRHIELIAQVAAKYPPRKRKTRASATRLSGLELLEIRPENNFVNVGERCNVAGSAKFARLIREHNYDAALSIARSQVEAGAQIIDLCMDDGMIESREAMQRFIALLGAEPEISRLPLMIDSSSWEVLKAGMKLSQGKSVVNSISLKEGEAELLKRAKEIHRHGAAAVVMLFDEQGQADTFERKIEVAERAYTLLTESGFPAEDIIFDPNVLSVATGIEAHDSYGKAFIDATRWIKQNLPEARVSGGVSNLSFSFRGNNTLREAMHSAFLYHAIEAGMDMAIVNAQMLQIYDQIPAELLERVEDVILYRRADGAERLIEFAEGMQSSAKQSSEPMGESWRTMPLPERMLHALSRGIDEYIESDTMEGYNSIGTPIGVIDELLMPAMDHVGKLFGEGKMFLPQVVKSARVMKRAVATLTPYLSKSDNAEGKAGKVLIATVKGDVHDIGKNIVSVVISCNGYQIKDLGVMVECHNIVDSAVAWGADVICLSGLITPSLEEMISVVGECESRGLTIPVIIGGATTSALHTAVKIAPHYSGVVIHADNASENPKMIATLLGEMREEYIAHLKSEQQHLRRKYEREVLRRSLMSYDEAKATAEPKSLVTPPAHCGKLIFPDFDISDVEELINWSYFFNAWGLKGRYPAILEDERYGTEAKKLMTEATEMLARMRDSRSLTLQGVVAIMPARSLNDDIIITDKRGKEHPLAMLRSQKRGEQSRSLADMVAPEGDHIGLFALTAGVGLKEISDEYKSQGDDYSAIMAKLLADRLTEAFAERVHSFIRRNMWGYEQGESPTTEQMLRGEYQGVRVAFGYPASPDHSLKRDLFTLLGVEQTTRMRLSETNMIEPGESICGMIFSEGDYFSVGLIDNDQKASYAARRGVSIEQIERELPNNL